MIVDVPDALDRNDVLGVLVLLFDFKLLREEGLSTYLRRGNVDAIVTLRNGNLCVDLI